MSRSDEGKAEYRGAGGVMDGSDDDGEEDFELDQEQIIQTILILGNEIWKNFGQEEEIDDVRVFFQHAFYIQCFQMAYPDFDFSSLLEDDEENEDPEKMAECIQALVDLLSQEILMTDMGHIRGDEIINGNPEHCINLLQILQQISSASMMQDASGDGEEQSATGAKAAKDKSQEDIESALKGLEAEQRKSERAKQAGINAKQNGDSSEDAEIQQLNEEFNLKNNENQGDSPDNEKEYAEIFGFGGEEDDDGAANQNKQQLFDNLEDGNIDEAQNLDKVGAVIGNISRELDIEFDGDIQDNLMHMQGRESGASGQSSGQQHQKQGHDRHGDDYDDDGEMLDHNDVNIIDDGADFDDADQMDDSDPDGAGRPLNRQTDNMGAADYDQEQMMREMHPDEMDNAYGDEIINHQNSSNFNMDQNDGEDLGQLHNQLENLDQEDDDDQYGRRDSQQIIDDQNLDLDNIPAGKGGPDRYDAPEDEDEDQHYPDDDDDDVDEDLEQLEELEQQMQQQQMLNMPNQPFGKKRSVPNQGQNQMFHEEEFDDVDPELREAAAQLGLNEEGVRALHQQMYEQRAAEEAGADSDVDQREDEDAEEGEELAEMLNDAQRGPAREMQIQDEEDLGRAADGIEEQQILRGGQNIEEEDQDDEYGMGEDQNDDQDLMDSEMAQQLKHLNEEDGDDGEGDDDDQLIDIDNLQDNEKAILIQYLQDEYQKNPDQLPMPKEVIEQFLHDNQDLIAKMQQEAEDEGEEGESDSPGAADSNQILMGQQNINEGAMMIEGEQESDNEEQDRGDIEGGEQNIQDEEDDQDQLEHMQHMNRGQLNDDKPPMQQIRERQYYQNEHGQRVYVNEEMGEQESGSGVEEDQDGPDGEEYDEDEQNQQPIFNPQYQLQDIQEVDKDGNLIQQNLNLQTGGNHQQQQMQNWVQMQQQQQMQMQMNQQMSQLQTKKGQGKKKRLNTAQARKPPLGSYGGIMGGNTGRTAATGATKKQKKAKMAGINTISHDDENRNPNSRYGIEMGSYMGQSRKNNSQKRPQTAKTRKTLGLQSKLPKKYNNYLAAAGAGFGRPISSTPSNRLKGSVKGGIGSMIPNTNGMMVPQQSQMFTSFGIPQPRGLVGQQNSLSQRKAAIKKRYGAVATSSTFSKKKLRSQAQQSSAPKQGAAKSKKNQFLQMQQYQQQQLQQQMPMNEMMTQNQGQTAVMSQNLVEMPILSEEFLNQLNEEQLQSLLEQQQQLMMLQQQQNQQANEDGSLPAGQEGDQHSEPALQQLSEGEIDGLQSAQQQQLAPEQQQELYDLQQQQQAMLMQFQQQQQQQQNNNFMNQQPAGANLRNRGRAKAYAQSGRLVQSAQRAPGGSQSNKNPGSGSRSRHGSRKRTQKTRSSLNVAGSNPLAGGSQGPGGLGIGPQSLAILPSSISKSKKATAQIYGSSAGVMLQNLISQRKKSSASQAKKRGQGKRSQPNQGASINKNQKFNMQAQLQAQQAQYNILNQQQMQQQQFLLQQQYQQMQIDQNPNIQEVEREGLQQDGADGMQDQNAAAAAGEAIIDEASPEQEDGESQNQFQQQQLLASAQHQMMGQPGAESNIMPLQGQIAEDLSTEQIIELLQNAANNSLEGEEGEPNFNENGEPIPVIPEEVQLQLQQVLQERMLQQQQQQQFLLQQQQMVGNSPLQRVGAGHNDHRVQANQNIYNILTESVSKAKAGLAHLGPASKKKSTSSSPHRKGFSAADQAGIDADQRIIKQKKQFETLLKQYKMDKKVQEAKRQQLQQRADKMALRDEKIKAIKQKKFEEQMLNQQRSQMFKRNAQQVRLCKKVYKLASDLEKNKLLEEKQRYKESEVKKQSQKKVMVDTIENYYKDKISMLKDRIDSEKFERELAQQAQKKALSQMKKELDGQKRRELERYVQLLQQEDDKYDVQNMDLGKLEGEIVKLYRKR